MVACENWNCQYIVLIDNVNFGVQLIVSSQKQQDVLTIRSMITAWEMCFSITIEN